MNTNGSPRTRGTSFSAPGFSFAYQDGTQDQISIRRYGGTPRSTIAQSFTRLDCSAHIHTVETKEIVGNVHTYCTFAPLPQNPAPFSGDLPSCRQTVEIGLSVCGRFSPAVEFGIVDDDRRSEHGRANYVPGAWSGSIDYLGPYLRPNTPYDFKVRVDLEHRQVTVWASGRGDDDWFPLAVSVPLIYPLRAINAVRVVQFSESAGVDDVRILKAPWDEGERVRPHPQAKKTVVVKGAEFYSRPMRSLWRQSERHVTVARNPEAREGWWLGFPDVAHVKGTELVCAHNDGAAHGGNGRVWVRRSIDLGRTWNEPVVVIPGGVNCPRIQKLKDGSLLVAADLRTFLHGPGYDVVFVRSWDGGNTWKSVGTLIPSQVGGHSACVPSRVTELPDGSWIIIGSWYPGDKPWHGAEGEILEFYHSPDHGASWRFHASLRPEPPHSISEASIVPLSAERWLLFARENYGNLPGVKSYSEDQGKTWGPLQELRFPIHGRTCAGLLADGRAAVTFRLSNGGPPALWLWADDPEEGTGQYVVGAHVNDTHTAALKNRELYIDSDGMRGQFTKYLLRSPGGPTAKLHITVELKVLENRGRAATLSIPFAGKIRFFPDRVELAHRPSVRAEISPGSFHTYRLICEKGELLLSIDGTQRLRTRDLDGRSGVLAWSPLVASPYQLAFGNEESDEAGIGFDWVPRIEGEEPGPSSNASSEPIERAETDPVYTRYITPAVTGCSVWRHVTAEVHDVNGAAYGFSWRGSDNVFPDQYQLDHIVEVEASASGCDQGYSGWVQLDDGRLFVLNYTDDTARWNRRPESPVLGVSWIRGTYVLPEDL